MAKPSSKRRTRPRLSRTLSRSRWVEYRRLLRDARVKGYTVASLEDWVSTGGDASEPVMVLRHDVDQHPRSALLMAAIEEDLGLRSTWYFRWRTAHRSVVHRLQDRGFSVGLHYETLSRTALDRGLSTKEEVRGVIDECRAILRREIAAFRDRFGPIRSVCPHGDSRMPWANNGALLRRQDCSAYGIEFDGNDAMRDRNLACWLTDRSAAEGRWGDAVDPHDLLATGASPILCLTHPNNWASGPSLWGDRLLSAALPAPDGLRTPSPSRPIRTGRDAPPIEVEASAVGAA